MEVDSVRIIAILSMSYITTRTVKAEKSMAKIPRVPVENQITTKIGKNCHKILSVQNAGSRYARLIFEDIGAHENHS